jgi:hypothetical protein
MVIGMSGQIVRQVNAATINQLKVGCNGNEYRRVAVFGDANGGSKLRVFTRHAQSPSAHLNSKRLCEKT